MKINLVFDPSVASSAPAGFVQDIQNAAAILDSLIANPITVTITVGINEVGGSPMASNAAGQGGPTSWKYYSYTQVQTALKAQANSALANQVLAALPAQSQTDPAGIMLSPAEAYALGLATPSSGGIDGVVGFTSTYAAQSSGVLYLHELTHALGRVRNDSLMSLYSYTAPGQLASVQSPGFGTPAYFSLDGGKTNLGNWDPVSDPSDWAYPGPDQSAAQRGYSYIDGSTDIALITALGFQINPAPVLTAPTPFQNWTSGTAVSFTIPEGTFYSAQPTVYSATLADGTALPSWLSFNATTGTFSGTPPAGFSGLSLKVTETNSLGTATDSFNVGTAISEKFPVANLVWSKGTAFSLSLASLFNGPVGATTQYLPTLAAGTYNFNGAALPSWMTYNAATATISGTMPSTGGAYTLLVTAQNPDGNIGVADIPIYSAAPPVVAHPIPTETIFRSANFSFSIPANTFSDAGGTITNSSIQMQDMTVANSFFTSPPSWMNYNSATMTLSGTAPASGSGKYQVMVTVTDSNGASVTDDFILTLANQMTVSQALAAPSGSLSNVGIDDSSANVLANLSGMNALVQGGGLTAIAFTDTPSLTMPLIEVLQNLSAVAKFTGNFTLTIPDAIAGDASFLNDVTAVTSFAVKDTGASIFSNLDSLETALANGKLTAVSMTDQTSPTVALTATQLHNDGGVVALIASPFHANISDSAANVTAALDQLQSLAAKGDLGTVTLTDGGIPLLQISASQLSSDAQAIKDISGYFTLSETAPNASATIVGSANSLGNSLIFSGNAASYVITPLGDGKSFTVAANGVSETVSNVQGLQFADHSLIVAAAPGSNTVTTGNVTELYGAVFGRLPDVPGLAYYQQELAANPSLSLVTLAQNFLASPEYQNNSAHNYAQTTIGDTQFITDLYNNLLHRAPGSGDAAWYEANVIAPIVGNATPGTAAYSSALALAHAYVVTDFSQSAEFLGNVQVTAAHPADANHWLLLI